MVKLIKELLLLNEGHHPYSVVFYVLKISKRIIESKKEFEKAVYNVTIVDAEVRVPVVHMHMLCLRCVCIHAQKTEHQLSYWSDQEVGRLTVGGFFVAKGVKVKVCARASCFCHGFVVLCAR